MPIHDPMEEGSRSEDGAVNAIAKWHRERERERERERRGGVARNAGERPSVGRQCVLGLQVETQGGRKYCCVALGTGSDLAVCIKRCWPRPLLTATRQTVANERAQTRNERPCDKLILLLQRKTPSPMLPRSARPLARALLSHGSASCSCVSFQEPRNCFPAQLASASNATKNTLTLQKIP